MTEDDDALGAWLVIARRIDAAVQRRHAEHFEDAAGATRADQPLRLAAAHQRLRRSGERRDRTKERGLALKVVDISGCHCAQTRRVVHVAVQHAIEPLRSWKRQRSQQDPAHEAEDRGVGADPERQRQHCDDRVTRGATEQPNGVPNVVCENRQHARPPPVRERVVRQLVFGTARRDRRSQQRGELGCPIAVEREASAPARVGCQSRRRGECLSFIARRRVARQHQPPQHPEHLQRREHTWPLFGPQGDDRFDLFVVEAKEGATPSKIVADVVPNALGPSWTPDGKHLVFVIDDDDAYDPLAAASMITHQVKRLDFSTVGHGDVDVVRRPDGQVWVAYVAQGRVVDKERSFDRLFVAPLTDLLP